jgi:hypothetical protein
MFLCYIVKTASVALKHVLAACISRLHEVTKPSTYISHTHVHSHIHAQVYIFICMHVCKQDMHVCKQTRNVYIGTNCTNLHMYMHACMYVCKQDMCVCKQTRNVCMSTNQIFMHMNKPHIYAYEQIRHVRIQFDHI